MMSKHSFPLRFERHTHVSLYAALSGLPRLEGISRTAALELIRSFPTDRLNVILGRHSAHEPLQMEELDDLPPVVLVRYSLHGFRLNRAAKVLMQVSEPELVEHAEDAVWCERHLPRLLTFFGESAGLDLEKLEAFMARLEALGIGAAEDMLLIDEAAWRVMRGSPRASRIPFWVSPKLYESLSPVAQAEAKGLKLFTDGALGTRTAALSEPYLEGGLGLLTYEGDTLLPELARLHTFGKPLAIHAIGDLALEQVLSALERADREGLVFPAVRIEHAQFITRAQGRRAKNLGVVLSMQPNFSSDSVDYGDRLDSHWLEVNNPFRMLIDHCGFLPGKDLLFGSDGMPHGIIPALQWGLFPAFAGQRLSLEELLEGYGTSPGEDSCFHVEIDEERRIVRSDGKA